MSDWVIDDGNNASDWQVVNHDQEIPEEEQSFLNKLPRNIASGLLEGGRGILNVPHQLKELTGGHLFTKAPYFEPTNFQQMVGLKKEPTLSDKLIQGLAQFAPALAAPEAALGRFGQAIESIPKAGRFLHPAARQAVPQAAYGATQNENPLTGAIESGAGSLVGSGVVKGFESLINKLKPSSLFKGNLTPEQLSRNLEVTKGTETNLGRVLESPTLNRLYENILPHVIGSGAEKTMQRTGNKLIDEGANILEGLGKSTNVADYGIKIQDALKKLSSQARNEKNKMYENLNKLTEKEGLKIGREEFQQSAKNILQDINKSPELKAEFGKELLNDINRYARNTAGNNLKLTNIFRSKLGDKANELYQAGKMHEYNLVNDLKESLTKDIENSINKSGKEEIKDAYQNAQKNYSQNFAPFEDKEIVKFTRKGGDPDLIVSHFIRGGKNDRSTILRKLTQLPQEDSNNLKEMLASAYLSKSVNDSGLVNPLKFKTLYDKLGKNQKEALFGGTNAEQAIKKYSELVGKNKESFNLMFNPKTGARNTDLIAKISQVGGGLTAGLPGLAASLGIGATLGKGATKLLTSEKIREKLINAMLKNKKTDLTKTKKMLPKISASLGNLNNNE